LNRRACPACSPDPAKNALFVHRPPNMDYLNIASLFPPKPPPSFQRSIPQ
jgi:hypothetical protein